jgi:hypothetical protein
MDLDRLLDKSFVVQKGPQVAELIARSEQTQNMQLFYGETFDQYGDTIDSLKYYFFVSLLAKGLELHKKDIKPTILVADSAAARNESSRKYLEIMQLGKNRAEFINSVNAIYNTNLDVVMMSSYIDSQSFISQRQKIIDLCLADAELMKSIELSVPGDKLQEEKEKGFMYSFDEITTIVNLDVKVGPPREDFYDDVARKIAKKLGEKELFSIYLKPSYPLGKNWAYFFANDFLDEFGVTAYKGGSSGLAANRLFVGRSEIENKDLLQLIDSSFCPRDQSLPNPVVDMSHIADMAAIFIEQDFNKRLLSELFFSGELSETKFKDETKRMIDTYIFSKFTKVNYGN